MTLLGLIEALRSRLKTVVFVGYGAVAPEYKWSDFKDVVIADKRVEEHDGRTTGLVKLTFAIDEKIDGVEYIRCFMGEGKVIHARVVAARQREAKALETLRAEFPGTSAGKTAAVYLAELSLVAP